MDRNRDVAEEGSPWQTDRSRERNAEMQQTDGWETIRSGRTDSEINTEVDSEIIWVRKGRAGSMKRDAPGAPRHNVYAFVKKKRHRWFSHDLEAVWLKCSYEPVSAKARNNLGSLWLTVFCCAELSVCWQWKAKGRISWFRCVCTTTGGQIIWA